jgi:hypothetical protein
MVFITWMSLSTASNFMTQISWAGSSAATARAQPRDGPVEWWQSQSGCTAMTNTTQWCGISIVKTVEALEDQY